MLRLLLLLLLPVGAYATVYVYTPGQPMQVISKNATGYTVSDMGGGGNTIVQDLGSMSLISRPGLPPAFIMDGGAAAREMAPQPLIPITPAPGGIDMGLPVGYGQ